MLHRMICAAPLSALFTDVLQDESSVRDTSLSYRALSIISQPQGVSRLLPCFCHDQIFLSRLRKCFPASEASGGRSWVLSPSLCRSPPGELVSGAAAGPGGQHRQIPLLGQGQPRCHPVQVRQLSHLPAPCGSIYQELLVLHTMQNYLLQFTQEHS